MVDSVSLWWDLPHSMSHGHDAKMRWIRKKTRDFRGSLSNLFVFVSLEVKKILVHHAVAAASKALAEEPIKSCSSITENAVGRRPNHEHTSKWWENHLPPPWETGVNVDATTIGIAFTGETFHLRPLNCDLRLAHIFCWSLELWKKRGFTWFEIRFCSR